MYPYFNKLLGINIITYSDKVKITNVSTTGPPQKSIVYICKIFFLLIKVMMHARGSLKRSHLGIDVFLYIVMLRTKAGSIEGSRLYKRFYLSKLSNKYNIL